MTWFFAHKKGLRQVILLLMLVSIIGPWIYDAIYVPDPNPCSTGFRVNENLCGIPLSGLWVFFMSLANVINVTVRFVTGEAGRREFLVFWGVVMYVVLPIVSLLVVAGKADENSKIMKLHFSMLMCAAILGILGIFLLQNEWSFVFELWGFWAYSLLVFASLVLEFLYFVITRRQNLVKKNMMV
jgi:hypothetical protein